MKLLDNKTKRYSGIDWHRLLKLGQSTVFGLDIGSTTVKAVQLINKEDTGWTLTAAGSVPIATTDDNDKAARHTNTVKAIRKCIKSAGISLNLAVCGVSGKDVAVRDFEFPFSLPEDEIDGAVQLEAGQICPFSVDDGHVDYHLISGENDKTKGTLVAATGKVIGRKSQIIREASLQNVLADVDGLALLNCFSECEKDKADKTVAILNVGAEYTNLAIMSPKSSPFVRDIACASNQIVDQMAQENDISTEQVRSILFEDGDVSTLKTSLAGSLSSACDKLISDILGTLRYYGVQDKTVFVERIFVCGGFSLAKGFVQLLNDQLGDEAVLWNPFENINCKASGCEEIITQKGPSMAVATGLAMRAI